MECLVDVFPLAVAPVYSHIVSASGQPLLGNCVWPLGAIGRKGRHAAGSHVHISFQVVRDKDRRNSRFLCDQVQQLLVEVELRDGWQRSPGRAEPVDSGGSVVLEVAGTAHRELDQSGFK